VQATFLGNYYLILIWLIDRITNLCFYIYKEIKNNRIDEDFVEFTSETLDVAIIEIPFTLMINA
jgi:hypothetical protein